LQILQSLALQTLEFIDVTFGADPALVREMSQADELAARVRAFAIRVVKFARTLPRSPATDGIVRQLCDAATSESANYHAARRGRSRREFVAKLGIVAEEADETEHWLAILDGVGVVSNASAVEELASLKEEATELRAIFVGSVRTARANLAKPTNRGQSSDP